jgi:phospholipase/lecithinase/hemolysin
MEFTKLTWAAVGASLLLAACGGGGDGNQSPRASITSLVSFGDSLSDVGNANVGTVKALGGGLWTVNAATAKGWTAYVAGQYGLPAPCAAQTGLTPSSALTSNGFVGAAITNNTSCLNYAQGSSRVTSNYGPHSVALRDFINAASHSTAGDTQEPLGLTALPITSQIDLHLTSHTFTGRELVTVMAGANDIFMNLNGVSSAAAGGTGAAGAAILAGWPSSVQSAVFAGGTAATTAATGAAVAALNATADELAGYIKTKIIANGAKYVVVLNVPDVSTSPYALAIPSAIPLISLMVTTFNSRLQSDLVGVSGVHMVDAYTNGRDQVANPAQYGLTNVTTPACSTTSTANPLAGSSLTCTTLSTIPGDTSHYLFADSVHFTPFEYQFIGQLVSKELLVAGWL